MTANTYKYKSDFCRSPLQKQILVHLSWNTIKCWHWGHRQRKWIKPHFNLVSVALQYAHGLLKYVIVKCFKLILLIRFTARKQKKRDCSTKLQRQKAAIQVGVVNTRGTVCSNRHAWQRSQQAGGGVINEAVTGWSGKGQLRRNRWWSELLPPLKPQLSSFPSRQEPGDTTVKHQRKHLHGGREC